MSEFRDINIALVKACRINNLELVKICLEAGAYVQTGNSFPLRFAAENGHKDVCILLIEHGADIEYAIEWSWSLEQIHFLMRLKNELIIGKN